MGEYTLKQFDCDSCMTRNVEPENCLRLVTENALTGEVLHKRILCLECYERLMSKANEASNNDEITSALEAVRDKRDKSNILA